jgi:putative ABC transport system permease protein
MQLIINAIGDWHFLGSGMGSYCQTTAMLKNYLKIAWRNCWSNKLFSLINILGLAVGMVFALLIGLWVRHEMAYDGFQQNGDRIAQVLKKDLSNGEKIIDHATPLPLYDELKIKYPEIEQITRIDWGLSHSLKVGDNKFNRVGFYADPGFLKMFSFPLLKGDPATALKDPASIVLTERAASALFGRQEPMGKIVRLDNQYDLRVTGILKDIPENSSLAFDFLAPFEFNIQTTPWVKSAKDSWGNNFLRTIVELKPGVSMENLSKRIENLIVDKRGDNKEATLFLHPMSKWYLQSDFKDWINTGGRIEYVRLFAIVGILVLLIACINFMNLSTARSEKRAKEVGIRKTIGSRRYQLVGQFLTESVLTAFLSLVLAIGLAFLLSPHLAGLGLDNISFASTNISLLLIVTGACLLTGLLAGSYPALYLSSFAPIKVLKGTLHGAAGASLPRRVLVVTQFTFSIALIISTVIVFRQVQHAKDRPLGYTPDNLIQVSMTSDTRKNDKALRQDLLNTGLVESISGSSSPMTGIWNVWGDFSWLGKDPNKAINFTAVSTDYDYEKTAGLKIKQGRAFSRDFPTDSNGVILNEAAVRVIGFKNPVGEHMKLSNQDLTVIGVVENVVMDDPFKPVSQEAIIFKPSNENFLLLRLKKNADIRRALAVIQPVFDKYNPAYPFEYQFEDEEFEKKFAAEKQAGKLAGIFACLAIFISCLGLFGLAAYTAERRTKEIGIRKILGASITDLWGLLSKEFVLLVLIASLAGSMLANWFMKGWLAKYEYRVDISYWIFIAAGILALTVTVLTVSFQAIRVALGNPVRNLRTE